MTIKKIYLKSRWHFPADRDTNKDTAWYILDDQFFRSRNNYKVFLEIKSYLDENNYKDEFVDWKWNTIPNKNDKWTRVEQFLTVVTIDEENNMWKTVSDIQYDLERKAWEFELAILTTEQAQEFFRSATNYEEVETWKFLINPEHEDFETKEVIPDEFLEII